MPELVLVVVVVVVQQPPVLVDVDVLDEVDVLVLDEVEELVELDVEDELEVLVETLPELDVLVETLPELLVVVVEVIPPVEVVVVVVEVMPPVDVEVDVLVLPPEVELLPDVELLPEVELLPVVLMLMSPPPVLPPKKPPKKPPPKPPPQPPEPPITVTPPELPPEIGGCGGSGGRYGTGVIARAKQVLPSGPSCSPGAHSSGRSITRRIRLTFLGTRRFSLTSLSVFSPFTDLMVVTSADCGSATWTAPPTSSVPPAAMADNFARAIRTDMGFSLSFWSLTGTAYSAANGPLSRKEHRPRHFPQSC